MNDNKKCPKCRTCDFNNCNSIQCPMRVEYTPITNNTNQIIDSFCKENELPAHVKNEIINLCKDSYIKGSNDCYNIWVKNK